MIIATFNVNSIRARLPILTRWLKDAQPDVLCLQETKVQDNQFPVDDIRSVGYEPVFRGEKSYNGVAILSKTPFDEVFYGFDGKGADEGSRIITAWVRGVPVVKGTGDQAEDPERRAAACGKFKPAHLGETGPVLLEPLLQARNTLLRPHVLVDLQVAVAVRQFSERRGDCTV